MLTENEIAERRRHVSNAVANQRLEGVEPDAETMEDLERFASGELEFSDVLARLKERAAHGEIRG